MPSLPRFLTPSLMAAMSCQNLQSILWGTCNFLNSMPDLPRNLQTVWERFSDRPDIAVQSGGMAPCCGRMIPGVGRPPVLPRVEKENRGYGHAEYRHQCTVLA